MAHLKLNSTEKLSILFSNILAIVFLCCLISHDLLGRKNRASESRNSVFCWSNRMQYAGDVNFAGKHDGKKCAVLV